jgi:hypothetical protein
MTNNIEAIKALAKAQSEMGAALKKSLNPHFKNKYADLASVQEACLPALNDNGIAVIQPNGTDDGGMYVDTIFMHESGGTFSSRVYLVVDKMNMQGVGSATTYARRYGLMGMAGIAPEDDDGHAASKAPPKKSPVASTSEIEVLIDLIERSGVDRTKFFMAYGIESISSFPADKFNKAKGQLESRLPANGEG